MSCIIIFPLGGHLEKPLLFPSLSLSHTQCRHGILVKHVVVESREDPVAGTLYNITPNGPVFTSLYELIEEAQRTPLIQNHAFNVQLTCSPPQVRFSAEVFRNNLSSHLSVIQPDISWLHKGVKSLSQAEQILRREHRDGSFFVYGTQSEYAPYIVLYRCVKSRINSIVGDQYRLVSKHAEWLATAGSSKVV
jgi:hypothetical protein